MSSTSDSGAEVSQRLPGFDWPPHIHSGRTIEHFHWAFLVAALPALLAGTVLFGVRSLLVCGLAVAGALIGERLCQATGRYDPPGAARRTHRLHAAVIGLLLALTLPVSVPWQVPLVGGLAAAVIGKGLLGGLGNQLWHPALVGWAILQLLFGPQVSPARYPVLAKGHLVTGFTSVAADSTDFFGFEASSPPPGIEAWSMRRPIELVSEFYRRDSEGNRDASSLLELFRDHLPPWPDVIRGHVAGGIGETCLPALLLGGLFLAYRGYIRWQLPAMTVITVAVLAAIWPIHTGRPASPGGDETTALLPLLHTEDGLPVGAAVVLFHLTCGGLWLGCVLLATDPISSPLTRRGQMVFGVGLGILIVIIRCNGWSTALPGGTYWAILGMSTIVPLIDRVASRRVLGTRL